MTRAGRDWWGAGTGKSPLQSRQLGVVVEARLLLGLHLEDGVHEVLVEELGGVTTQRDHALQMEKSASKLWG